MAAKITSLTENSWILSGGYEKSGLLIKKEDLYYFYSTTGSKRLFSDFEKIEKYFGKLKHQGKRSSSTTNISGYPTKVEDINIISEKPPIYTKEGSDIQFYAGYYGLKYEGGWSVVFCPKVDTCNSYEHIGPFRNKIEAKVEVNKNNNG